LFAAYVRLIAFCGWAAEACERLERHRKES
jgi:hypothetical protein